MTIGVCGHCGTVYDKDTEGVAIQLRGTVAGVVGCSVSCASALQTLWEREQSKPGQSKRIDPETKE